jgi:hypothetical protein
MLEAVGEAKTEKDFGDFDYPQLASIIHNGVRAEIREKLTKLFETEKGE